MQSYFKTNENFTAIKCKEASNDVEEVRGEIRNLKHEIEAMSQSDGFMRELTHEINLRKRC